MVPTNSPPNASSQGPGVAHRRRPGRAGLSTLALLLGTALAAPAARADVLDWAPPSAQVVFVFRGADLLADAIELVRTRFGGVPALDRALKRLEALDVHGVKPGKRDWGKGLVPGRGVAVFLTGPRDEDAVFAVGADDEVAAKTRLADLARAAGRSVEVTPTGFAVDGGVPVACGLRQGFLLCGQSAPPVSPPGAPAFVEAGERDATLLLHVRGDAAKEPTNGEPLFESFSMTARRSGDRLEIVAQGKLLPEAVATLAPMSHRGPPPALMSLVDAATPAILKLSFDGAKVADAIAGQAGVPTEPRALQLWLAYKAAFTGDLVISFDGGLDHPVLLVGVTSPAAGQAFLDVLTSAVTAEGEDLQTGPAPNWPGLRTLSWGDPAGVRVHGHYTFVGNTLVGALVPSDVQRRVDGRVSPLQVDPAFAAQGAHGLALWDFPALATGPWLADVVTGDHPLLGLIDAQIVLGVIGALVDELGVQVDVADDTLRMRAWGRLL